MIKVINIWPSLSRLAALASVYELMCSATHQSSTIYIHKYFLLHSVSDNMQISNNYTIYKDIIFIHKDFDVNVLQSTSYFLILHSFVIVQVIKASFVTKFIICKQ